MLHTKMGKAFDHEGLAGGLERSPLVVPSILASLVAIFLTWFTIKRSSTRSRLPPGPRGYPVLGALPYMGSAPSVSFTKLSKQYGPLVFMNLGSVPALVVSNAAMAKEVLKINDAYTASRPEMTGPGYITYGRQDVVFAPYGTRWRQLRKLCNLGLLNNARHLQFQKTREREVVAMMQAILKESDKGNVMNADIFFGNLTMNVLTSMMWNKKYRGSGETMADDEKAIEFTGIFREILILSSLNNITDFIPVLKPLSSLVDLFGYHRRLKAVRKKMDDFMEDIINDHKEAQVLAGTDKTSESNDTDDFVDSLLKLSRRADYKEYLAGDTIKALLLNMIVAGSDATAITMEWLLTETMRKPDVFRKVVEELDSVIGPDRLVDEDDLPGLKYLDAVVKETLRLHPPTPLGLPHQSIEDRKIGGYHIPAYTTILNNIFAIQRDPELWEQPEDFIPDRFLEPNHELNFMGQDFEYIPFGSGRRMCPGASLAGSLLKLAVAQLVHGFTLTLPGDQNPEDLDVSEAYALTVNKRDPLQILAKPRLERQVFFPPSS